MGQSTMKYHNIFKELPNWHFAHLQLCQEYRGEARQDISGSLSAGTPRTKKPPLPDQSFLVEIDDKWIIGCNQNIEAHIKFEI